MSEAIINDTDNPVPSNTICVIPIGNDPADVALIESLKGNIQRSWFNSHAYLCLPLTIANQYGFILRSAYDFTIYWNGGNDPEDTIIRIEATEDQRRHMEVSSHFSLGTVTISFKFMLRTPPGVNLMTINPPNIFIDGIGHMTGVVETDNLRRDFTYNLKVTRPHHPIKIRAGDPIGCVIPIPRYFVDSFELKLAYDLFSPELIKRDLEMSIAFTKERYGPDADKPHQCGRRYFNGEDVSGRKFLDHQKKIK